MEVEDLFKEDIPNEAISAFAFNTGRLIEHIIAVSSDNATKRVMELEAKILEYRVIMVNDIGFTDHDMKVFDDHFNIESMRSRIDDDT